jgi:hypothetical protein
MTDYSTAEGERVLQFMPLEEGRIRFKPAAGSEAASLQYDYFIKDHLGNVRMVLTEEQKTDKYPVASLEAAKVATEKNYYDIQDAYIRPKSEATASSTLKMPGLWLNQSTSSFSTVSKTIKNTSLSISSKSKPAARILIKIKLKSGMLL